MAIFLFQKLYFMQMWVNFYCNNLRKLTVDQRHRNKKITSELNNKMSLNMLVEH